MSRQEPRSTQPNIVDGVCKLHHNAYMRKGSTITVRLPASLKRRLESRAASEHRSLSSQVVADLENVTREGSDEAGASGKFLGLFAGSRLPTDEDIAEVRRLLWGRLGHDA